MYLTRQTGVWKHKKDGKTTAILLLVKQHPWLCVIKIICLCNLILTPALIIKLSLLAYYDEKTSLKLF